MNNEWCGACIFRIFLRWFLKRLWELEIAARFSEIRGHLLSGVVKRKRIIMPKQSSQPGFVRAKNRKFRQPWLVSWVSQDLSSFPESREKPEILRFFRKIPTRLLNGCSVTPGLTSLLSLQQSYTAFKNERRRRRGKKKCFNSSTTM